ncbi:MAG: hypothetical protein ACOZIN_11345 [Myxococcota bacterium]
MTDFKNRIRSDWPSVLRGVLDKARALGGPALLAFDLDSTLFDNRPRQARILREFGAARKVSALTRCAAEHWVSGWDMKAAMVACGLSSSEAEGLYRDAKAFWLERFFTSEYCVDDVPIAGAPEYLREVVETGATVAYVTGRHEAMRVGSVESMRKAGMATPGGKVHLLMKPTFQMTDDDWKREAHARLGALGTLIAAFDNEPTHVNDYARQFPDALAVHLATDHSGRPVEILEHVVSVPHFDLP